MSRVVAAASARRQTRAISRKIPLVTFENID